MASFTTDHHILWFKYMSMVEMQLWLCGILMNLYSMWLGFGFRFDSLSQKWYGLRDKVEKKSYRTFVTLRKQLTPLPLTFVKPHSTHTYTLLDVVVHSNRLDTQWGILILHNKWVITENILFFAAAAARNRSTTMQACDTKCVCLSSFCPLISDSKATNERWNAKKTLLASFFRTPIVEKIHKRIWERSGKMCCTLRIRIVVCVWVSFIPVSVENLFRFSFLPLSFGRTAKRTAHTTLADYVTAIYLICDDVSWLFILIFLFSSLLFFCVFLQLQSAW